MAKSKPSVKSNAVILANLPPGTARVKVVDEAGKERYKAPDQVADNDTIVFGADGKPVVMGSSPGRKKKTELTPATEEVAASMKERKKAIDKDALLKSLREDPDGNAVMDFLLQGLAEETASLGFERREAERKGNETAQISTRRINGYKALADTWFKRREQLGSGVIDLESESFSKLFRFILETVKEAMADAKMRDEQVQTVMGKVSDRISDDRWSDEAKARMKEN